MMNNILSKIIESGSSCLIIPHKSPDGDCLGTSLSLANFFMKNDCEIHVLIDETIPTSFRFLNIPLTLTSEEFILKNLSVDYAIIIDTSDIERVGTTKEVLDRCSQKVVIDHHKTNKHFGDYNIVEMTSSVGELLYQIYAEMNYMIDEIDAVGLYTSIVTDTGNFRYSNTTSSTLRIVSKLFETGFNFEDINRRIYGNQELVKVKLRSEALSNMQLYNNNKIVILEVTQELLKSTGCEMFHSDGIVEAGRDISGVEVSILLKEISKDIIKVSMRSKEYLDVSEVSLMFRGGGHSRAAGCTINKPLNEAKELILFEISERL